MLTPEFLRSRHSVRRFTDRPLEQHTLNAVKAAITMVNTHEAGMHFELITDDDAPFDGFAASYGMFHGVRNYIAAVVDVSFPNAYERAGYFAEQIVMKCVELGLGTCFVGGTFNQSKVKVVLRVDRKILFIIAVGYPAEKQQTFLSGIAMKMAHRHDKTPEDFFVEANGISFGKACQSMPWLMAGLEGLAAAPSALNRQPVRIRPAIGSDGNLTVEAFVDTPEGYMVDLGIGKFNFAAAADGEWDFGNGAQFFKA